EKPRNCGTTTFDQTRCGAIAMICAYFVDCALFMPVGCGYSRGLAAGEAFRRAQGEKSMRIDRLVSLTGLAVAALLLASPASALTMAECSTKYNAAKEAGTLDGQTWNQFRKAECGSEASAAEPVKPAGKTKKAGAKAE